MTAAPIPQTDPRAGYRAQKAEIDAAITRVLDSGQYILGREVEGFEAAISEVRVVSPADLGLRRIGHFGCLKAALRASLWPEWRDFMFARV